MILGFLQQVLPWVLPILAVLTLIITIHEMGHFLVARAFGVAVDRFSLGFGKPIVCWRSKSGMEWAIGWIPLGGYVKFSGDQSVASVPDAEDLAALRKAVIARDGREALDRYFHFKPLWQRALVVAAGPVANFILAIVIFASLAWAFGVLVVTPKVQQVDAGSPAAQAGFQPGDTIQAINGHHIRSFEDVLTYVLLRPGEPMRIRVERAGATADLVATPRKVQTKDPTTGTPMTGGQLGLRFEVDRTTVKRVRFGPVGALGEGVRQSSWIVSSSMNYIGRILTGRADGQQLRGTIGTAGVAKAVTTDVIANAPNLQVMVAELCLQLLRLAAFISVAVGFANLLPVPVLDGGHLLFYAYEAVARRPVAARVQDVGYRVGFAMIIALVLFTTWNDLNRYRVFQFLGGLFS